MLHETNCFVPGVTDFDYFAAHRDRPPLVRGADVIKWLSATTYCLSGFMSEMGGRHELVPLLWTSGGAGAVVTRNAYERIAGELVATLSREMPVDAVYLELHGAMVSEDFEDAEGELLRRVRAVIGPDVPLVIDDFSDRRRMKPASCVTLVPAHPRRYWLKGLAVAMSAGICAWPAGAAAQSYPDRAIRVVVPIAPSGSLDRYTRVVAQKLTQTLGQAVVVENRAGANGIIGSDLVAKSAPDGYTLLAGASPTMAINVTLYAGKMPYHPEKHFTPVTLIAKLPSLMAVHPSVPVKTIRELIALAKARPGKLNYGTSGVGSGNHLVGELLKTEAGIDMVHVPYARGGPALVALVSGQVEVMITPPPTLMPMVKAGRVRALAVSSVQRLKAMPEVPTIADGGFYSS